MAKRRPRRGTVAVGLLLGSLFLAHGCGIDLTDDLAGRPCKDQRCLPGYVCNEANVCVLDTGAGGDIGGDGNPDVSTGGTDGTGTEGEGGSAGMDASQDVPVVPDASDDAADVSTGGTAGSAGTAGTNGTGGTNGTAGTDAGTNPWPGTGCRQLTCDAKSICCVSMYPGYPTVPQATAFSCKAPNTTCAFTLLCDGDHDCPRGQQCCVGNTINGWLARCVTECTSPDYRVECTKPAHCGAGLECCGDWRAFPTDRFASVTCRSACNQFNNYALCTTTDDCPPGQTCRESASLPGFQVCQ
jgi:hypothetical protein